MQVVIYTSLNVIYDEKGQCVSKGLPGCDPIIYRYDKGNIPVLPYCRPQSVNYYDDDGVLKINLVTCTICQYTIIKDLKHKVLNIRVSLLNLIEEDHGVGASFHFHRQLATLVVSDISGGSTDQSRDGVLLHEFTHIHTDHGILCAKELLGEHLREIRLTDAGGS